MSTPITTFGQAVITTVGEGVYAGDPNDVAAVIACADAEGWLAALCETLATKAKLVDEIAAIIRTYDATRSPDRWAAFDADTIAHISALVTQ